MQDKLNKIVALLAGITQIITDAAAIYVRGCEEHPGWRETFRTAIPDVNGALLEMIGRGRVHPAFYGSDPRVVERIALLPMKVQTKILQEGITVVYEDGTTMKVPAVSLSTTEAGRALGDGKLRTAEQQQALLLKSRKKNVERGALYTIHSKSEATVGGRRVTYDQICEIKQLMEKFGE